MIQIAFVKWGTVYDHRHINGMVDEIRKHTDEELRVVVVTDDASGLYGDFHVHPFPDLGLPFEQLTQRSCYAKLSIFVPGILETGLKTLFFDLDTAVFGDVTALTDCLDDHRGIYLLPNQFIQFWQLRPVLRHIAPRSFYFANSSTIAFYPEDYTFIATEFRENMARWLSDPKAKDRPPEFGIGSDERFISFIARDTLRVFKSKIAARFQDKYFGLTAGMADAISALPLVQRTRRNRAVLTFMDFYAKPEKIVSYKSGDIIRTGPLVTRWDFPELAAYWQRILDWRPRG